MFKVLFVCTGNTCRSPLAEGVFRYLVGELNGAGRLDAKSAGIRARQAGGSADPRAVSVAKKRGYDLSGHRTRQFGTADLNAFDLVLAMDQGHVDHLIACSTPENRDRIHLLLTPVSEGDVPDPYTGTEADYERTLDLIEPAVRAWFDEIRAQLDLP